MAKREDLPRIHSDKEPTIFNGTMGKWAFWSSIPILAGIIGALAVTGATAGSLGALGAIAVDAALIGGVAVAGLIGGARGKAQMQQESAQGKTVSEPTFWNKGLLSGVAATLTVGVAANVVASLAGFPDIGAMTLVAAAVTAPIAGLIGGFSERSAMKQEFEMAKGIKNQIEMAQGRGMGMEQSVGRQRGIAQAKAPYVNSVNAEEMAAMNAAMSGGNRPREFARDIEQQRELAALQQDQRNA